MIDADVQDVRDMVAREKAQNPPPGTSEEGNAEFQQSPSESKDQRLGLKWGVCFINAF